MTILGILMLLTSLWKGFDVKGTVILALCLFLGIGFLLRSLSREMSREDRIAELDERNKQVELRAKSRALGIAEMACFGCILVSIVGMRVMEEFYAACRAVHAAVLQQETVILCDFPAIAPSGLPGRCVYVIIE